MKNFAALLVIATASACASPAYYVANVYQDGPNLYTERCALDGGRHGDKPDPGNCRLDRVGPLPGEYASQAAAQPPAPPPPPPAPPQ